LNIRGIVTRLKPLENELSLFGLEIDDHDQILTPNDTIVKQT